MTKDQFLNDSHQSQIFFRKVRYDDCDQLLEWANDPVTRKNSFNTELIEKKTHSQWLKSKLEDPNTIFLLFYLENNVPLGQVRIVKSEYVNEISVAVNPEKRGSGYGGKILTLAIEYYYKRWCFDPIVAYIKPSNNSSLKVFEAVGFINVGKTHFKGFPCIELIKYKNE